MPFVRTSRPGRHLIVVDLGYGDAGKGGIVDHLAGPSGPPARAGLVVPAVIRFNGGAQAAHTVVTPDGRRHTFAQFGSGTLHGVPTLLSRYMLVEPLALAAEAGALARLGVPDPFGLLSIDRDALLSTGWHAAVNRAREVARGAAAHGSCGIGVGETVSHALAHPQDVVRARHCTDRAGLARRLRRVADWAVAELAALADPAAPNLRALPNGLPAVDQVVDAYAAFAERVRLVDGGPLIRRLAAAGPLLFEGAQGVLLDENRGFHPHTTWSTTTAANALALLAEAGVDTEDPDQVARIGVSRSYSTRHGAGPLVSEDPALAAVLPEPDNGTGRWQGAFRLGHLDLVGLRYAVRACGRLDALAVTHLDSAAAPEARALLRLATAWQLPDGSRLTDLPLSPGPDLAHQEQLTALARLARPVLQPLPAEVAARLGAELELPVWIRSHGPAWTAKVSAVPQRGRSGPVAGSGRSGSTTGSGRCGSTTGSGRCATGAHRPEPGRAESVRTR